MTTCLQPFLVGPRGCSLDDARVVLVLACGEDEAVALHPEYGVADTDTEVQVISLPAPSRFVVSPAALAFGLPDEFIGETRALPGQPSAPGFIVPDFLAGQSRAVIYARVSTQAQVRNSSLVTQRETCEAFAQVAGLAVISCYEEAESGVFYEGRPQLQAALRDLEKARGGVLLVATRDRLARDTAVDERIEARVRAAGGFVISCEMQEAGSPEHEFALHMAQSAYSYKLALAHEWGLRA